TENFSHPAEIDNQWMPLKPGTQMVYGGWKIDEEDRRVPYQLIVTVTDLMKDVDGIETVVVLEQYFANRKLEVSGLAFRARDNEANVWLLGEVKEFYDEKDRKSTRLNSSHQIISYAVFCLKKKK